MENIKNKELIKGIMYDVINVHKILYEGNFKFGLPYGEAKVKKMMCLWLNGCLFKYDNYKINDLDKYKKLNINHKEDLELFTTLVKNNKIRNKNNYCNLHFSSNLFNTNYNLKSNKYKKFNITIQKINNNNLYYLDNYWQKPVATEYNIFKIYKKINNLPCNYFAFPWATLIDQNSKKDGSILINTIKNYQVDKSKKCFTKFVNILDIKNYYPYLKKLGLLMYFHHIQHILISITKINLILK